MTTTQSIHPEQELPDSHVHTEINVGDIRGGAEQDSGLLRPLVKFEKLPTNRATSYFCCRSLMKGMENRLSDKELQKERKQILDRRAIAQQQMADTPCKPGPQNLAELLENARLGAYLESFEKMGFTSNMKIKKALKRMQRGFLLEKMKMKPGHASRLCRELEIKAEEESQAELKSKLQEAMQAEKNEIYMTARKEILAQVNQDMKQRRVQQHRLQQQRQQLQQQQQLQQAQQQRGRRRPSAVEKLFFSFLKNCIVSLISAPLRFWAVAGQITPELVRLGVLRDNMSRINHDPSTKELFKAYVTEVTRQRRVQDLPDTFYSGVSAERKEALSDVFLTGLTVYDAVMQLGPRALFYGTSMDLVSFGVGTVLRMSLVPTAALLYREFPDVFNARMRFAMLWVLDAVKNVELTNISNIRSLFRVQGVVAGACARGGGVRPCEEAIPELSSLSADYPAEVWKILKTRGLEGYYHGWFLRVFDALLARTVFEFAPGYNDAYHNFLKIFVVYPLQTVLCRKLVAQGTELE
eukprot:jgi/Bigna1/144199/aug1.85_g18907